MNADGIARFLAFIAGAGVLLADLLMWSLWGIQCLSCTRLDLFSEHWIFYLLSSIALIACFLMANYGEE